VHLQNILFKKGKERERRRKEELEGRKRNQA
jgi:hypothetical protein